jgi:hypothetical protein
MQYQAWPIAYLVEVNRKEDEEAPQLLEEWFLV